MMRFEREAFLRCIDFDAVFSFDPLRSDAVERIPLDDAKGNEMVNSVLIGDRYFASTDTGSICGTGIASSEFSLICKRGSSVRKRCFAFTGIWSTTSRKQCMSSTL
ncbi:hypothetical protein ATO4_25920 [Aurantimonas sp. 22II-16-19i]|nr:hypothetical protein ATO4_25920 [Aurantimonas sp. 22II-16-19i]